MVGRRKFLVGAGIAAGGCVYVSQRGLRFPRLSFEHRPSAEELEHLGGTFRFKNAITVKPENNGSQLNFRAIAPEPELSFIAAKDISLTVSIENVSADAELKIGGAADIDIDEKVDGTQRTLKLNAKQAQTITFNWTLAAEHSQRFAVIGDTGAGLELEWMLNRAVEQGAQFLLHLGDFNYSPGEYQRAIELFKQCAIPCYVSIGNHDFNEKGHIYQKFLDQIGPMNQAFEISGVRFVNIDSAASFFPAGGGLRGKFFDNLREDTRKFRDHVVFTHKPFEDPRPGRGHDIGGWREIPWLHSQLQNIGADTILTGHVHKSAELDYQGIRQITAGEGLGFEDIVHQKQVASFLMGDISHTGKVNYQWQPINMPWSHHLSPTHEIKLKLEHPADKLEWYRNKLRQVAS